MAHHRRVSTRRRGIVRDSETEDLDVAEEALAVMGELHAIYSASPPSVQEQADRLSQCCLRLMSLQARLDMRHADLHHWHRAARAGVYKSLDMNIPSTELPLDPSGHYVYKLYSGQGELLYVGRSSNVLGRLGAHMSDPHKADHVKVMFVTQCASHEESCAVEALLIAALTPPLNAAVPWVSYEAEQSARLKLDRASWTELGLVSSRKGA